MYEKESIFSTCYKLFRFIRDVSFQKLGAGIEIGWADAFNVPIIFIYKKGSKLSCSLNIVSNEFMEYKEGIDEILSELEFEINKIN